MSLFEEKSITGLRTLETIPLLRNVLRTIVSIVLSFLSLMSYTGNYENKEHAAAQLTTETLLQIIQKRLRILKMFYETRTQTIHCLIV